MTQQINLLDPSLLPARDWCTGRHVVIAAVALAVAVGGHAVVERVALQRLLARAPATGDDAAAAPDAVDTQLQAQEATLAQGRALLAATRGLGDLPQDTAGRFAALVAALPDTVWLREVEFTARRGVRIAGGALAPTALADLSRRLGRTAAYQGLPLHVFALEPLAEPPGAGEGVATALEGADGGLPGGAAGMARGSGARYGFVLSGVDAETPPGGTP